MKKAQPISSIKAFSKLLSVAVSQNGREESIREIGFEFYRWATIYFHSDSGTLNRFIVREELFIDFNYWHPETKITPSAWKEKLGKFCQLQGYILNPEPLMNSSEAIIAKVEAKIYNKYTNQWTKDPDRETRIKEVFFVSTISMSSEIGAVLRPELEKFIDHNIASANKMSIIKKEIRDWRLSLGISILFILTIITLISLFIFKHGTNI